MNRRDSAFARALRAHDVARLGRVVVVGSPAVLFACVAVFLGRPPLLAALLVVVTFALLWIGRGWSRGWWPGFLSGVLPFAASALRHSPLACATSSCTTFCMVACSIGGLLAGIAIGIAARHERTRLAAAALTAIVMGSLGCTHLGTAAVVGMAAAVVCSSSASAFVLRARPAT